MEGFRKWVEPDISIRFLNHSPQCLWFDRITCRFSLPFCEEGGQLVDRSWRRELLFCSLASSRRCSFSYLCLVNLPRGFRRSTMASTIAAAERVGRMSSWWTPSWIRSAPTAETLGPLWRRSSSATPRASLLSSIPFPFRKAFYLRLFWS